MFTFTPNGSYTGSDTFAYKATDSLRSGTPTTVNITYGPSSTVSGMLNFEAIASSAPAQNVTFTFRPTDGTASFIRTLSVPASGVFSLANLPKRNYTVHIKGDKYLAANVTANLTLGSVTGLTAFQNAGDANNDNSVDSSDFGILIGAFNASASIPGSGYDASADFNGDGLVDSTDFGILIGNFGSAGSP